MSGGFFRGTSADQDTRFSNKQAKLLKTQKFATELDHLVDMTKVKMDVMKPWIATRVTELLGFEDEVLINFIYGLLEPKDVNGKEVQISLTGFMEKHTVKFMKELWTLLLSAQKNVSGVPQQFLDAKEEETRKKKLEADRIANEIQKKKEKESRELDQQRSRNMDGAVEMKATEAVLDPRSMTILEKDSISYPKDEKEAGEKNGVRGRTEVSNSIAPRLATRTPSSRCDRRKSRSVSRSPKRRKSSPRRRSITPRRRYSPRSSRSPLRTSYFRQRSRSHSPRRSPSSLRHSLSPPFLRKSPLPRHRRSPSPVRRRRSPSPVRRRRSPSPVRRRRSPSPLRHRRSPSPVPRRRSPSPVPRRRSPSPVPRRRSPSPTRHRRSPSPARRRRSPLPARHHRFPYPDQHGRSPSPLQRYQSPLRMRRASPSPFQHRSPSPTHRLSPSPMQRRAPSPMRHRYLRSPLIPHRSPSPIEVKSPMPSRLRSPTHSEQRSPPYESSSPSPARHRNLSMVRRKSPNDCRRSPMHSPRGKYGNHEKLSTVAHQPSSSLRSPQRDPKDRKYLHKRQSAFSSSPERSPTVSESPRHLTRKRGTGKDKRSFSPDENPVRHTTDTSPSPRPRERRTLPDFSETSKEDKETNHARADVDHKSVPIHGRSACLSRVSKLRESPIQDRNKKEHSPGCERLSGRGAHPGTFEQQRSPAIYEDSLSGERQWSTYPGESKISERNFFHKNNGKDRDVRCKTESATMEVENVDQYNRNKSFDSGSAESDEHKTKIKEKRKHKKHDREEVASDDDYSYDSEIDKEAQRRKEEKKLRREEKRRRRDERRRRKEERRAAKLKMRNQSDAEASDDEHVPRRENHPSHDKETESAQKKLEIELRNKALESIKVPRNSSH